MMGNHCKYYERQGWFYKVMSKLDNSNTILITDYNAPYGGNLLRSFIALEKQMVSDGNQLFYLFPN